MRRSVVIFLALVAPCCNGKAVQTVTPVEKVINLLEKLQTTAQEEGVEEAAAYDKFACFCKAQADAKLLNIATCESKIEKAAAKIKKLQGEIAEASGDVADGNVRIDEIKKEMEEQQQIRSDAHHEYTIKHADVQGACTSVEEAIEQMEASPRYAAFIQVSAATSAKLSHVLRKAIMDNELEATEKQMDFITSFLETTQDPAGAAMASAAGFKFHSGEIFDNLREVLRKFKKKKAEVEVAEEDKKHTFNMAQSARAASLQAQEDAVARLEETIASKEEESSKISTEKDETDADQKTDQTFLEALTDECEKQATAWDQRSKARSKELMALAEALTILKDKVAGTYGANKKLNLIKSEQSVPQATSSLAPAAEVDSEKAAKIEEKRKQLLAEKAKVAKQEEELEELEGGKATSFLQINAPNPAAKKVMKFLMKQSKKINSPVLATLVMRMKADHFAKIRGMIKDLVAKLEASAEEEETQKAWCDDEMEKATGKRDEQIGNVEDDLAAITETKAKIDEATEEVSEVEVEIAALYKNVNEANTLRKAESAENAKTLKDAKVGLSAIKAAIAVLKDFYDNALLIQTAQKPVADAEGKTIGDMAPKVDGSKYEGKQDAASGILGMMAVIESDFEGTIEATETSEKEAVKEHKTFVKDSEDSITEKKDLSKKRKGDIKQEESNLVDFKDDLRDHAGLKKDALDELAKLKPPCVSTGSSYDEKVKRREQEIESLKDAYKIFAEMTLLETKHEHSEVHKH
jgi:DNA repair exonuclease SbcCD ATPase subunit